VARHLRGIWQVDIGTTSPQHKTPWKSDKGISTAMKLLKYLKAAARSAGREYLLDRYLKSAICSVKVGQPLPLDVSSIRGRYILSTEKGIFLIIDDQLLNIFPYRTYGIALRGGDLYLSSIYGEHNYIFKTELSILLEHLAPGDQVFFREIYHLKADIPARIHQIGIHQDQLAVAKTSANAVAFLNLVTGEEESEIQPFVDFFGMPISGDHNHINSVFSCGEVLLVGAYRAGDGSFIGAYHQGKITGYRAGNEGLHGVYISDTDLYYGDTFGSEGKGYLMINNEPFDEPFFQSGDGFCIRGVCQSGKERLVGHSHKGPRARRFDGPAFLLRCNQDQVEECIEMPFAAIYDIMNTDGTYFDRPPLTTSWNEINQLLQATLGDPIYEHRIHS